MLRILRLTVAIMLVLALGACNSLTGPASENDNDTNALGPRTIGEELSPPDDGSGGGSPGVNTPMDSNNHRTNPRHDLEPGAQEGGGGGVPFTTPTQSDDDDHRPVGGDYEPIEDGGE